MKKLTLMKKLTFSILFFSAIAWLWIGHMIAADGTLVNTAGTTTVGGSSSPGNYLTNNNVNSVVIFTNNQVSISMNSSGLFTWTNYAAAGLSSDATLTISGNDFTLTSASETQSGRITAVTTCGYTAATMMFGNLTPPPLSSNPPPAQADAPPGRLCVTAPTTRPREAPRG